MSTFTEQNIFIPETCFVYTISKQKFTVSSSLIHFFLSTTDSGLAFSKEVYPICLPYETNEIADKWQGKTVEVIGFATTDFVGSKADSMKVAEMEVFSQAICNNKLNTVLEQNKKCKSTK